MIEWFENGASCQSLLGSVTISRGGSIEEIRFVESSSFTVSPVLLVKELLPMRYVLVVAGSFSM